MKFFIGVLICVISLSCNKKYSDGYLKARYITGDQCGGSLIKILDPLAAFDTLIIRKLPPDFAKPGLEFKISLQKPVDDDYRVCLAIYLMLSGHPTFTCKHALPK